MPLPVFESSNLEPAAGLIVIVREDDLLEDRQNGGRVGVDLVQDEVQKLAAARRPRVGLRTLVPGFGSAEPEEDFDDLLPLLLVLAVFRTSRLEETEILDGNDFGKGQP